MQKRIEGSCCCTVVACKLEGGRHRGDVSSHSCEVGLLCQRSSYGLLAKQRGLQPLLKMCCMRAQVPRMFCPCLQYSQHASKCSSQWISI